MKIILLNGPSSAGKSTISKALKKQLDKIGKTKIISIDDYLEASTDEPFWEDDVYEIMPNMCADIVAFAQEDYHIVIDHVITSQRIYESMLPSFQGHKVLKVFVSCTPALLRQREAQRKDRFVGSAETSLEYLYPKTGYDIRIDSGKLTPEQSATEILTCLNLTIRPFQTDDLDSLYEILSDEEVMKYLEPPFSKEKTKDFLISAGISDHPLVYAVDYDGFEADSTVDNTSDCAALRKMIGYVIYHDYDATSMELGFVLHRSVWGRGLASSLTRLLIEKARLSGKDAVIECVPEQYSTKRIAEKCGFSYCGMDEGCEVYRLKLTE